MLHSQIENEEIVERYILNRLAPEQRQAFEEHFFACEECFEKLQATERFVAGVRDTTDRGLLTQTQGAPITQSKWFIWAFAASVCVAVVFAALGGWMFLSQMPRLRGEVEHTSAELQSQQQTLAQLEQQISSTEANLPLVILQASRAQETSKTVIPLDAKRLVVWIELGPTRYRTFRMEVSRQGHTLVSINNLQLSDYGALTAGIPTNQLPTGNFRIKLTGQDPPPASLVGEYQLQVRRP